MAILFGVPASPFVRKIIYYCQQRQIDFTLQTTLPGTADAAFRTVSPLGKVPAWQDEHIGISDSSVIIQYLERQHSAHSLLPADPVLAARALWFEEFADSRMVPALGGHLFAEVVLAKTFFKRDAIQADIELALTTEIPDICAYLEAQLTGDYLVGDSLSVADIAVGSVFTCLWHCGYDLPEAATNLYAWLQRLASETVLGDVVRNEITFLQQIGYTSPAADYLPN